MSRRSPTEIYDVAEAYERSSLQSARLSAVANRRSALNGVLADCPVDRRIAIAGSRLKKPQA